MRYFWEWLKGAGFITPRFLREVIADSSGRKAHGIKVRVWSAAIFYFAIGLLVGAFIVGGAWIGSAAAHPGGLNKAGCHMDRDGCWQ